MTRGRARRAVVVRRLQHEEALSSWYVRSARASGMSLHELGTALVGHSIHREAEVDLDPLPTRATLALAVQTGTESALVHSTALLGCNGPLSGDPGTAGPSGRWILDRRSIGYQKRTGAWVQACPACLAADEVPYFRRHWRLAFVTECIVHGEQLIDRCPGCGDTLDFLRDTALTKSDLLPLSFCANCGIDIKRAERKVSPPELLEWQRSIIAAWHEGWLVEPGLHVMVPLYLDGMHRLQRLLRSSRGRCVLLALELQNSTGSESAFESLATIDRRMTLHALAMLLKPWPSRLLELGRRVRLRWSDFTEEQRSHLPFWMESVCREHFDRTWYQPSAEELESIRIMLIARRIPISHVTVMEWAGARVQKRRLSEDPMDLEQPIQLKLWPAPSRLTERELHRIWVRRLLSLLAKYCWRQSMRLSARHRNKPRGILSEAVQPALGL
jgi:hypothetical protein